MKKFLDKIISTLTALSASKFTGRLVISVSFNTGGCTALEVTTTETFL